MKKPSLSSSKLMLDHFSLLLDYAGNVLKAYHDNKQIVIGVKFRHIFTDFGAVGSKKFMIQTL